MLLRGDDAGGGQRIGLLVGEGGKGSFLEGGPDEALLDVRFIEEIMDAFASLGEELADNRLHISLRDGFNMEMGVKGVVPHLFFNWVK